MSDGSDTSDSAYTMTVDVTPVNDPATGRAWIEARGEWRVGNLIRASTSGIRDIDGLPAYFFHDWVIVNADGTETKGDFLGSWYWLREEDVGKKIRLRVSFVDGYGRIQRWMRPMIT